MPKKSTYMLVLRMFKTYDYSNINCKPVAQEDDQGLFVTFKCICIKMYAAKKRLMNSLAANVLKGSIIPYSYLNLHKRTQTPIVYRFLTYLDQL